MTSYAIAAILLTLLIASGVGSRFSDKFNDKVPFIGIIVWLILDIFLFKNLMYTFSDLTIYPRILLSILVVAPLGFFMGMPFPKGALKVRELVDWGFAVNGAASVLGSTAILLVAFSYGFTASLICARAAYLIAMILVSMKKSW